MITHSSRPLIYASGLALLWLVLALLSSDTTYHLAPLLVAGVPPTFEGTQIPGLSWKTLAKHSLTGLSLALVTTLLLSLSGLLAGPSLFPVEARRMRASCCRSPEPSPGSERVRG
jgi:hypothetical protein